MKKLPLLSVLLLILPVSFLGQAVSKPQPIKILIEANEWNRPRLLEKLNRHGAKHGMKFTLAEEGYGYKVRFATGKTPEAVIVHGTGGTFDYDTGFATVYDSQGRELFQIKHEAWWSESGAINGTAKDIVKRLREMTSKPPDQNR